MGVHDFDYDMYVVTVCPEGWLELIFNPCRIVKFFLNIILLHI